MVVVDIPIGSIDLGFIAEVNTYPLYAAITRSSSWKTQCRSRVSGRIYDAVAGEYHHQVPSNSTQNFNHLLLEHISPCVILVIYDNPYGLMVALSYIFRICPYALLEVHLLVSRSLYDDQGGIQSIIQRLVIKTQG